MPHSNVADLREGIPVTDPDQTEQLRLLEERITALRKTRAPAPAKEDHHAQAQLAWRMVTELVAGLGIGASLGYGLDILAGTLPWGLIVFTLLGFTAGVKTMLRSANEAQRRSMAQEAGRDEEG